jgi:cytoskeletal protein RodZ
MFSIVRRVQYDRASMPKKPHKQETESSSRATLAVLAVGGVLVAALVGWALTRTVETHAPVATTETSSAPSAGYIPSVPTTTSATTSAPAATSAPPVTEGSFSEESKAKVARIAVEDLREKMKAGQVTVIDVRPAAAYQAAHIQGALNIPLASIETEMSMLPKSKPIVTYCT